MTTIRTLVVAAEAFPLAKTGGLGDAVAGMLQALGHRPGGVDVQCELLMPAYRGTLDRLYRPRTVARLGGLPGGPASLVRGHCPGSGLSVLLLRNDALYDRPGIYVDDSGQGYPDNARRYAALAHAAARLAQGLPGLRPPHVVHAHDWHAALAPLLIHAAGLHYVKTLLTIHNLAFQGTFPAELASALGIPLACRHDDGALSDDRVNFLKAGIRYATRVTTVSRAYAREILTPAFGCGLHGLLRARGADLSPVPNGIDTALWNPAADPHLGGLRFDALDMRNKACCKAALQAELGLQPRADATVLAMGSRLTGQKMADVAIAALPALLEAHEHLQFALIGRGEPDLEAALRALAARYPGRCAVHIGYDEPLAHRLHAGADLLLHGSRFEPFGLTPLYAMRYGTLPVASRVGGMVDTIRDPGPAIEESCAGQGTGFLFDGSEPADMQQAVTRALRALAKPAVRDAMRRNAMQADFSWRTSAQAYAGLYANLAGGPQRGRVPAPTLPLLANAA
ncbi:putative starch [bacterial glycogen] synthase [Bordetella bronchiseptica SBL-F6116]|uniref:glycogen synthase GlgA n=1 Tax=Bordetella bronchiseptica TaxID=518 RepID=UPI00045A42E8|nr:glycogen synthase GlgA [Bordetella bronchiseptica]KCV31509.1 putative starch [bacterial glycogen] synthase [Bordetella bronchiseptica 00-P-2730]KDE01310.1 putative starch [bacterial glycogen] synthase [Bordetella bronchiseptica SBL-F6116]